MKAKYDREGVQYIQDEIELADGHGQGQGQPGRRPGPPSERAETLHGGRKPGQTSSGSDLIRLPKNVNMGADNDNQKNPLTMIINAAKKSMGGGN